MKTLEHPFIKNKIGCAIYDMSADMAQWLLNNYYGNIREESRGNIERIKTSIRNNRFAVNNDFVTFEANTGIILNGHHRLTAIAECGKTVTIGVLYGVNREVLLTMDTGNFRTSGVCISASRGESQDGNKIWKKRASVANMCLRSANGFKLRDLPDNAAKEAYYVTHQSSIDSVIKPGVNKQTNGRGFRSAMALFFQENPRKAQELYNLVTGNGEDIPLHSAAYALYRYFDTRVRGQAGEDGQMRKDFYVTRRAIQAFKTNAKLQLSDLLELC